MKKYLAVAAVVVLAAFAAPAFAATNPFMDVPINHWSYDAIGQLAARGVLSGYPDGTYKGKQPTTRYEMASALARALALVDLTKASKQDVEMLKKLVVEFKDELDALGVRVDQIDGRLAKIEDRLGGWKITGVLRADLLHTDSFADNNAAEDSRGYGDLARARLFIERWFGEDESMHFFARLEGSDSPYSNKVRTRGVEFTRFYAEVPAFFDTKLILGRYVYDFEAPYYLDSGQNPFSKHMSGGTDNWLGDRTVDAFGVQKSFGLGSATFYVAHPLVSVGDWAEVSAWEVAANAQLQFTEQFGFDLGIQAFFGDDAAVVAVEEVDIKVNNLWTLYAGLRFNFNEFIAIKGMYYHQTRDAEIDATGESLDFDDSNAFKVVVDVKQDLLKFTSLWLEYNKLDVGFYLPTGRTALFNDGDFGSTAQAGNIIAPGHVVASDLSIWRIAAQQQWTDKWSTFLYYANFDVDAFDAKFNQFGGGVNYQLNPSVLLGLSYAQFSYDDDFGVNDESQIRFRTQVSF
ncbi:MAG: S-layer homology domain-containing protein [Synergistaceae bacterium]|jgi:opacity protein-like surface antigen|nr:S-layer homology domain-containing protein [Synergistaceae bacterium]